MSRPLPTETRRESKRAWAKPTHLVTIEPPGGPMLRLSDRYIAPVQRALITAAIDPVFGLGSELMGNGDFSAGLTGWTVSGSTVSLDTGRAKIRNTNTTSTVSINRSVVTVAGHRYRLTFPAEASVPSLLNYAIRIGTFQSDGSIVNQTFTPGAVSGALVITVDFTAGGATTWVSLRNGGANIVDLFVDDVSVKEITVLSPGSGAVFAELPEGAIIKEYLGLVADWGTVDTRLNPLDAGGAPGTWEGLRLTNLRRIAGYATLAALAEAFPLEGAAITLQRLGPSLSRDGLVTLFAGFVEDLADVDQPLVTIRASDRTQGLEDALGLPRITRDVLPYAPRASLGGIIRVPFGSLSQIPCRPIVDGAASQLASAIDIVGTSIPLDDVDVSDDFPDSGTVLIGFELIPYTGKSGRTLTGCTRGGFSTQAAEHAEGAGVFEARSSYVFEVGRGRIDVANIRVSGVSARTSPVASLDGNLIPGTPLTIITFPVTDMQSFHVIGAGGTFPITPITELKIEDPATSQTRTISPGFAFSAPNSRTVTYTIPFSGGSPVWNVQRRLAGGTFVTIASGSAVNLPFTDSHTADYLSDGDDQIQMNIIAGSGYDVHLQFNSYSIAIESNGTTPSGASTSAAVLGDVTCDVVGIRDDGFGSISGTPNLPLELPADATKYILHTLYGWPLEAFGPRWAATRGAHADAHLRWAFLLGADGPVAFSALRRKVGEQSCSRLLVDEEGRADLAYLAGPAPVAGARIDYARGVCEDQPIRASKTTGADRFNRVTVEARRTYATGDYAYTKTVDDLTRAGFTRPVEAPTLTLDFVQDPATADAVAAWRLREVIDQRWEAQLVGVQNLLPDELLDAVAFDNHPSLADDLVFHLVGKRHELSAENPSRIGLTAIGVPV